MLDEKEIKNIKNLLDAAENNLRQAKALLFSNEFANEASETGKVYEDGRVVEGIFDGEEMVGPNKKKYPVPANYASKSKLVPGDQLKLTIAQDGSFLFKQIGPVQRKKIIGVLEDLGDGKYAVVCENTRYRVLPASVTYFKAQTGDNVTILIPENGSSEWAAMENKI